MADSQTIEAFDRNRRQYYRGYVFSFAVFALICASRLAFKLYAPLIPWLNDFLFIAMLITIMLQLFFLIQLSRIKAQARQDPELKAVLADELTKFHQLKAWKYAFFSIVACLVAILFISALIGPTNQITTVIMVTLLVGLGAYHVSFWFMEKQ